MTRTHAIVTPKPCQDRKVAAIGDAYGRRELRVFFPKSPHLCPFPPELVIEIISPGQSFGHLSEKATDYLKAGVSRVWLVDSKAKSITVLYPDAPPKTKRGQDSLRDEVLPELEITVQRVFQQAGLV